MIMKFQTQFRTAAVVPEVNDGVVLTRPGESMTVSEFLEIHVRKGIPFDPTDIYRRVEAPADQDEEFDDAIPEADYDLSNAAQDAQKVDESVLP